MKNKKVLTKKKHTPLNDVGFGTKKNTLEEIGIPNTDFDLLNEEFTNKDISEGFEDDLYDGIDELEE
jgi:hypothetical protein|tara:strand:- start:916 stop:1116 length:201 start_codon:yes stop_codon:yes gene_type:complete